MHDGDTSIVLLFSILYACIIVQFLFMPPE